MKWKWMQLNIQAADAGELDSNAKLCRQLAYYNLHAWNNLSHELKKSGSSVLTDAKGLVNTNHGVSQEEDRTFWILLVNDIKMLNDIAHVLIKIIHMNSVTFAQAMTNWKKGKSGPLHAHSESHVMTCSRKQQNESRNMQGLCGSCIVCILW